MCSLSSGVSLRAVCTSWSVRPSVHLPPVCGSPVTLRLARRRGGMTEGWWAVLGWTVLHHAVPETNCANATVLFVLWATGAGTVRSVQRRPRGGCGCVCVCACVHLYVCGTNIGQAVINSGRSLTSQTVNRSLSVRFYIQLSLKPFLPCQEGDPTKADCPPSRSSFGFTAKKQKRRESLYFLLFFRPRRWQSVDPGDWVFVSGCWFIIHLR